jgi:hypothetical protein
MKITESQLGLLARKKMIVFDVDGTLAVPLHDASDNTVGLLLELARYKAVSIVTGNGVRKMEEQLLSPLVRLSGGDSWLLSKRFDAMLLSGAERCCFRHGQWRVTQADHIDKGDRETIVSIMKKAIKRVSGIPAPHIEDRKAQVTFLACGTAAGPKDVDWDANGSKRKAMVEYLTEQMGRELPGKKFNVKVGGQISIDVMMQDIDKAFALRKLGNVSGIAVSDMAFIGDGLFPGGNDYAVLEDGLKLGVDAILVKGPKDTDALIKSLVGECARLGIKRLEKTD